MAGLGQVNSYLVGPAREGAGKYKRAVLSPAQYLEKCLGFFAFSFPNRPVFAADFPDIRIRGPRIIFRNALDPCEIFLLYTPFREGFAQGHIYPLCEREEQKAAGFPVESVVKGCVAVCGLLLCQMAKQGRKNIVAGVVWSLLAWNTGFLVVYEKKTVAKDYAGRIDLVEPADSVRRKGSRNLLFP